MSVLEIQNIKKSFKHTQALKGISFSVPKGSIFGILGPNGSGKTTLMGILLDVLKADSGNFQWFSGEGLARHRQHIGTLLETPNFYHYLSAKQNLEITRRISNRGSRADIDRILHKVGLFERRDSAFSTYSLGMKQRLAIGAALLGAPKVIMLDEPTNGLDPVGIADVRALLVELKSLGHTVIIASHLLDEIEKVCTHVAIMKQGELLTSGPVSEVLRNDDLIEISASDLLKLKAVIAEFPGLISVRPEEEFLLISLPEGTSELSSINAFCFNKGINLNHLTKRKQRLEARFFELTQN